MDPNETLKRLRILLSGDLSEDPEHWTQVEEGGLDSFLEEASELFDGLDTWLTNKGFLPKDWER